MQNKKWRDNNPQQYFTKGNPFNLSDNMVSKEERGNGNFLRSNIGEE
jgi:hypothetical protein